MTYKLYTAYRLPYDGTISDMKTVSDSLRQRITRIVHVDMLTERIAAATLNYDKKALLDTNSEEFSGLKMPEGYNSRYSAWFNEMVEHRGANQKQAVPEPYITLFIDEETPEWLYLIPRNIPIDPLDDILRLNDYKAEDYAYWNNSDRPDDVTESEWMERKDTWRRIGVWNKSVEECGWVVKIIADFMLRGMVWDSSDDIANPLFPEFEQRVNRIVIELLQDSLANEITSQYSSSEELSDNDKAVHFDKLMRAAMDAIHMVMDKEPLAVSLAAKVSPNLKRDLTMELLRKEN